MRVSPSGDRGSYLRPLTADHWASRLTPYDLVSSSEMRFVLVHTVDSEVLSALKY